MTLVDGRQLEMRDAYFALEVQEPPEEINVTVNVLRNGSVMIDFAQLTGVSHNEDAKVIVATPGHGRLVRLKSDTYRYLPETWYLGADEFTYKVQRGRKLVSGTVYLNVVTNMGTSGNAVSFVAAGSKRGQEGRQAQGAKAYVVHNSVANRGPDLVINWDSAGSDTVLSDVSVARWGDPLLIEKSRGDQDLGKVTGLKIVLN